MCIVLRTLPTLSCIANTICLCLPTTNFVITIKRSAYLTSSGAGAVADYNDEEEAAATSFNCARFIDKLL